MRREKVNVAAEFAKERGGAQHKEVLNLVVIGRGLRFRIRSGIFLPDSGPDPGTAVVSIHNQLNENGQFLYVYSMCIKIFGFV
jgi:hypothetical protein